MCHLVTVLGSRALGCEGESSLGRIRKERDTVLSVVNSSSLWCVAHNIQIYLVHDYTTGMLRGDVYTFARRLWSGISRPEVKMSDSTTRQTRDLDVSCLNLEDELVGMKTHWALVAERFLITCNCVTYSMFEFRHICMMQNVVLFSSSKWSTFQSIITRLLLTFDIWRYIAYSLVNPYRES